MIFALIWRNLWRNRRRSLITMASVTFAVLLAVTMKSLQKGVFDNLVKNVVSFYSGYVQVHKDGYFDEQVLDNSFDFSDSLVAAISRIEHVTGTVARIESFALASSGTTTHGCLVVGTQPEAEDMLTQLKSKVIRGTYFTERDGSLLISEGLAEKLSVDIHDTLVLLGQGYHGSTGAGKFPIGAIAHFGAPRLNESLVFLPLMAAQSYLSAENKITTLAINIDRPEGLEAAEARINQAAGDGFEVLSWKKMMPDIEGHIRADSIDFYIFIGILYLLIAFGIFGTVLMMLSERRYELGMLMAIGMRKWQLGMMLVGETILVSVLGTVSGMLISWPVVKYFEMNPLRLGGSVAEAYENWGFEALWPAASDAGIFMTQALIVFCIALVIGIFPISKVKRMDAVTSMKR